MALRLGVDLKLFDAISARSKSQENGVVTVQQISEDVKADPKLVRKSTFRMISGSLDLMKNRENHEISFIHGCS